METRREFLRKAIPRALGGTLAFEDLKKRFNILNLLPRQEGIQEEDTILDLEGFIEMLDYRLDPSNVNSETHMMRGLEAQFTDIVGINYTLSIVTGDFEINGQTEYNMQVLRFQSNEEVDPIDIYKLIEERDHIFTFLREGMSIVNSFDMYLQRELSSAGATNLITELKEAGIPTFSEKTIYAGEKIRFTPAGTTVETTEGIVTTADSLYNHIFTFSTDSSCAGSKQERCGLTRSLETPLTIVHIKDHGNTSTIIAQEGEVVEWLSSENRIHLYETAIDAFFDNDID